MGPSDRLLVAVKAGDTAAVARALDAEPTLAEARHDGVPLLVVALYHGHRAVAELVAARRPHLDVHELAALGHTEALRVVLARVPELAQQVAADGYTPLGLASFFCHEGAVLALLDAGADPRLPSRNEMHVAPLHSAVARRCLAVARLLIERGADVNARQAGGFTALHGAAANGDRAIAELLIERGADPLTRDDAGRTPREVAAERGHLGLADWLSGIAGG